MSEKRFSPLRTWLMLNLFLALRGVSRSIFILRKGLARLLSANLFFTLLNSKAAWVSLSKLITHTLSFFFNKKPIQFLISFFPNPANRIRFVLSGISLVPLLLSTTAPWSLPFQNLFLAYSQGAASLPYSIRLLERSCIILRVKVVIRVELGILIIVRGWAHAPTQCPLLSLRLLTLFFEPLHLSAPLKSHLLLLVFIFDAIAYLLT